MRVAIPLLVVLAACAAPAGSDPSDPSDRSEAASPSGDVAGPSPGGASPATDPSPRSPGFSLAPASEQPVPSRGGTSITGVIGFDTIEGGCGYVETDDGTRYEVLWPNGWTLRGNELRDAQGSVVARVGEEVTVYGEEAEGMASICQIGPIFQATDVEA